MAQLEAYTRDSKIVLILPDTPKSVPMLKRMEKKTRPKGQRWKRFMWPQEEEGMGWDMETSSRSEDKMTC